MMGDVRFRVSAELLRQLLRLDGRIVGVGGELSEHGCIELTVRDPDAPAGAVAMDPVFKRHLGPDPIHLEAVRWLRADGTEVPAESFPTVFEDAA